MTDFSAVLDLTCAVQKSGASKCGVGFRPSVQKRPIYALSRFPIVMSCGPCGKCIGVLVMPRRLGTTLYFHLHTTGHTNKKRNTNLFTAVKPDFGPTPFLDTIVFEQHAALEKMCGIKWADCAKGHVPSSPRHLANIFHRFTLAM